MKKVRLSDLKVERLQQDDPDEQDRFTRYALPEVTGAIFVDLRAFDVPESDGEEIVRGVLTRILSAADEFDSVEQMLRLAKGLARDVCHDYLRSRGAFQR